MQHLEFNRFPRVCQRQYSRSRSTNQNPRLQSYPETYKIPKECFSQKKSTNSSHHHSQHPLPPRANSSCNTSSLRSRRPRSRRSRARSRRQRLRRRSSGLSDARRTVPVITVGFASGRRSRVVIMVVFIVVVMTVRRRSCGSRCDTPRDRGCDGGGGRGGESGLRYA